MFRARYLVIVSTCWLLFGSALIIPGLAADSEQSSWAPPGLSRAQGAETKAAIKKLWEFYLEEKITKDEYLLGEELLLKTVLSLDSVEKKLRSAYQGAISGELEASKLGRVVDMIESPSQRKARLRLKQIRQEERLLEGQIRELLAAAKAQQ